jgi:hypothetical protein
MTSFMMTIGLQADRASKLPSHCRKPLSPLVLPSLMIHVEDVLISPLLHRTQRDGGDQQKNA